MAKRDIVPSTIRKHIDVVELTQLIEVHGLTYEKAAKQLDVSKQAVWKMCKKQGIIRDGTKKADSGKLGMLKMRERQALCALTPEKQKESSAYQITGQINLLGEAIARAEGKPTQVIGWLDMVELLKQVNVEEAKLGGDAIDVTPEEEDEADVSNTP